MKFIKVETEFNEIVTIAEKDLQNKKILLPIYTETGKKLSDWIEKITGKWEPFFLHRLNIKRIVNQETNFETSNQSN